MHVPFPARFPAESRPRRFPAEARSGRFSVERSGRHAAKGVGIGEFRRRWLAVPRTWLKFFKVAHVESSMFLGFADEFFLQIHWFGRLLDPNRVNVYTFSLDELNTYKTCDFG